MALSAGTMVGPYEVAEPLGAGGMGEVYRARDTRLHRSVALKVLPADLSRDPDSRRRLEREGQALSSLQHPNICTLHDIGTHDGQTYLVMECLQGSTLEHRLRKGALPLNELLPIAIETCEGLQQAHRRGIVHRDLKPGNVMLTPTGVKLMDFGIARTISAPPVGANTAATEMAGVTAPGGVVGTYQYMAPEQITSTHAPDARTDIFALGAVLYEMATGSKAFQGGSAASVMAAILERPSPTIGKLHAQGHAELDWIIRGCLAKDPDDRWQSVHDIKLELIRIRDQVTDLTSVSGKPVPSRTEVVAWAIVGVLLLATAWELAPKFRAKPETQLIRSSLLPPPGFSFVPNNFSLSPDGTRLAFVAVSSEGRTSLFVRSLSQPAAQQLGGTENASEPFWSPDSHRLGFFSDGKLKTVFLEGGAVVALCDVIAGAGATWNANGTIVFAPNVAGSLFRIPDTGGTPTAVTTISRANAGQAHRWPFFLPDGEHFLFFVDWSAPDDPHKNGIYVGSLRDTSIRQVLPGVYGTVSFSGGKIFFFRENSLMAAPFDAAKQEIAGPAVPVISQEMTRDVAFSQVGVSVSQNGAIVFQSTRDIVGTLTWFDSKGNELGQLQGTNFQFPRLSPDGRFLAFSSDDERNGKTYIRVLDLARGVSTRLSDEGAEESPTWSPDGHKVLYTTHKDELYSAVEVAADGSLPPKVVLQGARIDHLACAPDGSIVFSDFSKGRPHLTVYSRTSQIRKDLGRGAEARFSPDGKWIAYTNAGDQSYSVIFVAPYAGPGPRIQISNEMSAQPVWSTDGGTIYFVAGDKKMMAATFDPSKQTASAPHPLFQTRIIAPYFVSTQYDITKDGRFLINSLPRDRSSPLTLLTNVR